METEKSNVAKAEELKTLANEAFNGNLYLDNFFVMYSFNFFNVVVKFVINFS